MRNAIVSIENSHAASSISSLVAHEFRYPD